jgi:predicted CDP-diglyceride synthetase/phosphatidate cytidylyltransferase
LISLYRVILNLDIRDESIRHTGSFSIGILDRFDSVMFIAPFVTMVITAVFYA